MSRITSTKFTGRWPTEFTHLLQEAQHVIVRPTGYLIEGVAPRQFFEHRTREYARPSQKNRRTCSQSGRICICFLWARCLLDSPRGFVFSFLYCTPPTPLPSSHDDVRRGPRGDATPPPLVTFLWCTCSAAREPQASFLLERMPMIHTVSRTASWCVLTDSMETRVSRYSE